MATVQFEALDGRSGCPRSYENSIFRSETGDRVRLQQVRTSADGRHFEAEVVLLEAGEDGASEIDPGAGPGGFAPVRGNVECCSRRRSRQPSQRAQEGRPSRGGEGRAEAASSLSQRESVRMTVQQVEGSGRRSTRSASQGELVTKDGDLLSASEDYLVHVCDCISAGRARGLAARLFERYPEANVYEGRRESDSCDIPGDASVHAGRVINLYAQFASGPPMADVDAQPPADCEEHFQGLPPGRWDTAEDRLDWFSQCLDALPGKLPAEGPQGRPISLAVPVGIGCGIGCAEGMEGRWPQYLAALRAFAGRNPQLLVVLYDAQAGEETVP